MAVLRKARLRAGTLLETMIALVIIVTIFGIATMVLVRVTAGSASVRKLRAERILERYAEDTRRQGLFTDEERSLDSFIIRREVKGTDISKNLWQIHYIIYDQGRIPLAEWQQLVLAK